jgi:pilus assembly protein Flp/PilA
MRSNAGTAIIRSAGRTSAGDADVTNDLIPRSKAMLQTYIALKNWKASVADRVRDDEGATAVEYGLMVALIAVVIIGAVLFLGESLDGLFRDVGDRITEVEVE